MRRGRRRNPIAATAQGLLVVVFCIVQRVFFRLSVESYASQRTSRIRTIPSTQATFQGSLLNDSNAEIRKQSKLIPFLFAKPTFALSATNNNDPEGEQSREDFSSETEKQTAICTSKASPSPLTSRRAAMATMTTTSAALALLASSSQAMASVAEIDKSTGLLYTPKKEMLAGGSAAARGIRIEKNADNGARAALKEGQQIQNVYETRFITYLSRFLINFDDAANGYWKAKVEEADGKQTALDLKFAEFSESVEIGLADYFVGPYGSYSSLSAMKAGISAKYQAKSKRYEEEANGIGSGILRKLAGGLMSRQKPEENELTRKEAEQRNRITKEGVLNLYTLLKARYKSKAAKLQLAILFSFISNPAIQPTAEIRSLLAEADDASVTKLELNKVFVRDEITSRTSCKRGGGYSVIESPEIAIDVPPALGSDYKIAKAQPVMRCTSRLLRIKVLDGGAGYTKAPDIYVGPPGGSISSSRQCVAQAILNRKGGIESILVLDPGYGYGKSKNKTPPKVIIKPPDDRRFKGSSGYRQALAKAELEYEIASLEIIEGGNGYVNTEPPKVYITPPQQEPDWFVDFAEVAVLGSATSNRQPAGAVVVEMRAPTGNLAYSPKTIPEIVPTYSLKRVRDDPIGLLPTVIRPERSTNGSYFIPSVAAVVTKENVLNNPRFRAFDPLFGAIGALPVQKSALELKPNEYGRLALSGAVCTVLVRTALNPLELIKTKLQLENDEELLTYARNKLGSPDNHGGESGGEQLAKPISSRQRKNDLAMNATEGSLAVATKTASRTDNFALEDGAPVAQAQLSAQDLLSSLIEMRGFPAIFQSADITLLASIMFGSLGFGATELFRRSFTEVFFMEGNDGGFGGQLVLLAAAAVATVITCAAAAPFELMRVRSMGLVEAQKWTTVTKDYIGEKMDKDKTNGATANYSKRKLKEEDGELDLKSLAWKDYVPLWAGFGPTTSRELAFAIPKFLAFDIIAKAITGLINSQLGEGALPIQVGVGGAGLAVSAFSGACAGIAGAFVSHPADLILTRLSASSKSPAEGTVEIATNGTVIEVAQEEPNWKDIVKELLSKEGGVANLYVGLTPRLVFFFLVIGLQFFLYDYVKTLLEVGSDDLSLVLDVFYAVRQGLIEQSTGG